MVVWLELGTTQTGQAPTLSCGLGPEDTVPVLAAQQQGPEQVGPVQEERLEFSAGSTGGLCPPCGPTQLQDCGPSDTLFHRKKELWTRWQHPSIPKSSRGWGGWCPVN